MYILFASLLMSPRRDETRVQGSCIYYYIPTVPRSDCWWRFQSYELCIYCLALHFLIQFRIFCSIFRLLIRFLAWWRLLLVSITWQGLSHRVAQPRPMPITGYRLPPLACGAGSRYLLGCQLLHGLHHFESASTSHVSTFIKKSPLLPILHI